MKITEIIQTTQDQYEGYLIYAGGKEHFVGINGQQCCCEAWDIWAEGDIQSLVGKNLVGFKQSYPDLDGESRRTREEYQSLAIEVLTDQGSIKICMSNEHNGYYSHEVVVKSDLFSYSDRL